MAGRRPPRQRQSAGVEGLHWFIDVTAQRRYEIVDRQLFPDGFVQQHILREKTR
jgi:hypothetical protein